MRLSWLVHSYDPGFLFNKFRVGPPECGPHVMKGHIFVLVVVVVDVVVVVRVCVLRRL